MRTLLMVVGLMLCFLVGVGVVVGASWSLVESNPDYRMTGALGKMAASVASEAADSVAGADGTAPAAIDEFPPPKGMSVTIGEATAQVGRPYRLTILVRMTTHGHAMDELTVPTDFLSNFEGVILDPRDGEPSDADGSRAFPLNRQILAGESFSLKLFLVPKRAGEFVTELEVWCNEYENMLKVPVRITVK